ncbi:MAG TPA: DUF1249 domain-containing protein [Noviherbaspirillum sp.]|nr:DUF1249 domain-containing protein [Noviherbaspirillum sp.]
MTAGHSSENIYTQIYQRLMDVIPDLLTIEGSGRSEVAGLMPLNLDVIRRTPDKLVIALCHYYRHESGDMIADPDMEIAVHIEQGMAEALTYQDSYMYHSVYSPDRSHVDILAKRALNGFLYDWLGNLIAQGHAIKTETSDK